MSKPFQIRLTELEKEIIKEAVVMIGCSSISEFIRLSAIQCAKEILKEKEGIKLIKIPTQIFYNSI